jgi:hypothetical protein
MTRILERPLTVLDAIIMARALRLVRRVIHPMPSDLTGGAGP